MAISYPECEFADSLATKVKSMAKTNLANSAMHGIIAMFSARFKADDFIYPT